MGYNEYDRPQRNASDLDYLDELQQNDPIAIDVFEGPPLTVKASASPTTVTAGATVDFSAAVSGNSGSALSYTWSFDGGAPSIGAGIAADPVQLGRRLDGQCPGHRRRRGRRRGPAHRDGHTARLHDDADEDRHAHHGPGQGRRTDAGRAGDQAEEERDRRTAGTPMARARRPPRPRARPPRPRRPRPRAPRPRRRRPGPRAGGRRRSRRPRAPPRRATATHDPARPHAPAQPQAARLPAGHAGPGRADQRRRARCRPTTAPSSRSFSAAAASAPARETPQGPLGPPDHRCGPGRPGPARPRRPAGARAAHAGGLPCISAAERAVMAPSPDQ